MSGVSYRVDTRELERLSADLVERISQPRPALQAVADLAEQTIQRNFTAGGRPTKWAPLKLRDGQPLRDTGRLMNSISAQPVGDRVVMVGTNVVYAAIHNFGGQAGRGHKVTIPQREFMIIPEDEIGDIQDTLQNWIVEGKL
jgi:phage virion morphogenesis protein